MCTEAVEALPSSSPQTKKARQAAEEEWERKIREIERLVGVGKFSQAAQRLTSPGLAADTPQVKERILGKFPANLEGMGFGDDLAMPSPGLVSLEAVLQAVHSFKVGAGPGPDGLRADFLKAIVADGPDESLLPVFRDFVQLLADGLAPTHLCP